MNRRTSAGVGCRILLAGLLCMLINATAAAQGAHRSAQWQQLIGMFDGALRKDQIVGGSVALVENGRIVARHDYGFEDQAKGKRVDGETVFHWASITKTLNAIAMMQLRDRRMLSLEDPLTRYLPELRQIHNPHGSMDAIQLRMVLDHSGGFQPSTWPYKKGEPWEPFEPTQWSQLVAMMPYQRIEFPPGTRYSYSNPSWIYAAQILEQLTGDPWEAYIHKNLFAPLGMTNSYFGYTPLYLREHRSHRYLVRGKTGGSAAVEDLDGEFDPGITIPNGGWNSPLSDVAAYIAFLTNATGGDPKQAQRYAAVLRRSTLEEMWERRFAVAEEQDAEHIGLGFFIFGDRPQRIIGHTGGQGGFSSFFYFCPENGRGVVAAFNTANLVDGVETSYFGDIRERAFEVLRR